MSAKSIISKSNLFIAAAGITVAVAFAFAPAAKADSVGFGVTLGDGPGYGAWGGDDWRWHHRPPPPPAWGIYDDGDDYDGYDAPPPPPHYGYRLSCNEAADVVRDAGFRNVHATDCGGQVYQYDAFKNGQPVNVDVTASGRIVGVDPGY